MASSQNTMVFSSLSAEEERQLLEFQKESFYFTGEDFANFKRWQEFYNLFFLYHVRSGDGETTVAQRRSMEPARLMLYSPSLFDRFKGTDLFSAQKLVFDENEARDLHWFKEREMILSVFAFEGERIRFVHEKASFVIELRHKGFFKKLGKLIAATPAFQNHIYLLFLISVLLLKKDRFASSKLFDPFRAEELEKAHLYYQKLADRIG
ncbi:MAG TPA: hypothetical protein P5077_04175 [bacterium]|nr:hypothetical protein [bacterium]